MPHVWTFGGFEELLAQGQLDELTNALTTALRAGDGSTFDALQFLDDHPGLQAELGITRDPRVRDLIAA